MARRLEDARERLTAATKRISALCVRRPVLTIVPDPARPAADAEVLR